MLKKIVFYFLTWRVILLIIVLLVIPILPLQPNFLGGGISTYLEKPYLWAFANFDGEHYIEIARWGYRPLTYFYFPLYPIFIKTSEIVRSNITKIDPSLTSYMLSGLIISNVAFLAGLVGLYKLVMIDLNDNIAKLTILLILFFPTSFFFGSVYTESLFFTLTVWSFYFARRGNWLFAGILGGLSAATRIIGLALFPALIIEYFNQYPLKNRLGEINILKHTKNIWGIIFVPLGILTYMYFLNLRSGDPLGFLNSVNIFGEQRSSVFVSLPQVFYRYFFKIMPNLNYDYFPLVFTTFLELIAAVIFGVLGIFGILGNLGFVNKLKIRPSYTVYFVLVYLIPTLSGSFSSMPRYVLICFPAFILSAILLNNISKVGKAAIFTLLFIMLVISTAFFARGYWVS